MRDQIGHSQVDSSKMVETPESPKEMRNFLSSRALDLKPPYFKMPDVKWKHAIRSALRGKNLMFTGPSGCGKTMGVIEVRKALGRPFHYMNLGSTQDPRTSLVGTREAEDGTTYFKRAPFANVIQEPNSMILLDEISRAHPEAWNILLTVLDPKQRYLQVDEDTEQDKIPVADGVCFMSTANIGTDYTSTRKIDRALEERFTIIEMEVLGRDDEFDLLTTLFPNVEKEKLDILATIAGETRREAKIESKINRIISTRQTVQMAEQIRDGYLIMESIKVTVYPNYDNDGGDQSPRSAVKKIVQKEVDTEDADSKLFDREDMKYSREMGN